MSSSPNEIPERMLRNSRGVDPKFDQQERLFRRCSKDQVSNDDRLLPSAIGYTNWSVNREKYGEATDVLIPDWPLFGVAVFRVEHLPKQLKSSQGSNIFDMNVRHVPLEQNYAHSEVVTFKNGILVVNPDPPTEVKKKLRQIISDRSSILKVPEC